RWSVCSESDGQFRLKKRGQFDRFFQIRYKRLEKAKELLLSTKMSITEICYNLGFENIAHFSRLFKIQFSQTPTEYRMNKVAI
ncbi:AraC family transcriptional regulator, partial [Flavobacterium sp. LC2016-13]|uniref:helix-turn-helix domain-containing protein n=1 Tax=Flavobacterium sp. LC2016-13 TaxID=2675875 RepID=UPI0012B6BC2D